jgi:hypothetical protein
MATISARLQAVKARIAAAAQGAGRAPEDVRLLAVSKTFAPAVVREAVAAGQRAFGENYVQEAIAKMDALADPNLEWHFIGPLQSNKTSLVAQRFDWVHSVDRLKVAQRLAQSRGTQRPPLQVCLQVNLSGEASKGGVPPEETEALACDVVGLPGIRLRGLMTIPEPTDDVRLQRARFAQLRELQERLIAAGLALDTLSMGMSADLESAVQEGATIVRIGTAIFGERRAG